MPPAYIVVDTSWEDPDDDQDDDPEELEIVIKEKKIDTKIEKVENILDNQIRNKNRNFIKNYWKKLNSISAPDYRCPKDYWHCRILSCSLHLAGKQLINEESFNSANWHCPQQLEDEQLSKMLVQLGHGVVQQLH